ncbi:MAG: fumarylacetoacetate hydrolase family protein [Lachnospiraceae bacterium]|nr:fumarylacetoacetate hydrolase family protein [Lachnospiraceae bacterium]
MRFYTVSRNGKEEVLVGFPGGEELYSLAALGFAFQDMNDVICNMTKEQKQALEQASEEKKQAAAVALTEVTLCAPIVKPLQDVVCLGINYDEHAKEAGRFSAEAFGGERPYTIYFSKRVNRATATEEEIPSYTGLVDSLDYEVELGVILGKDAKNVNVEEAEDYIFGYTIINDISARNLQTRHKQWYLGKSLDGFTPMGPCIVTADEIPEVQNLQIRSLVNGEQRQSSNTRYMIQTVAGAIAELSAGMTLAAGTIIATGTPAGVGMGMNPPQFLQPGDEIICEIEGIGVLRNFIGRA